MVADSRGQEQKSEEWRQAIVFTATKTIQPNLDGELICEVLSIQNTLIAPKTTDEAKPILVTNRRAPVNETSLARFTCSMKDDPDLPPGNYKIRFSAHTQDCHAKHIN